MTHSEKDQNVRLEIARKPLWGLMGKFTRPKNTAMIKNVKLGFSTGALYKSAETKEAISIIKNLGCKAIEIGFVKADKFLNSGQLERIEKSDLEGFDYVSLHAPGFDYNNDKETINIFEKISNFSREIRRLDLVVFHPDTVNDFSIFDNVDFKIGFENMDHRKGSCRTVEDIELVLSQNSRFKLILDVNHVWINDPTMKLAQYFYKKLGDKIAQIHLSGFKELHDPLFETKQLEIIKAIQNLDVPIIIESVVAQETIKKERDYILDNIG